MKEEKKVGSMLKVLNCKFDLYEKICLKKNIYNITTIHLIVDSNSH